MLAKWNMAVIATGPIMVHQNCGLAATPNRNNPHQKDCSPN
jgi:hypothetical protein